jgi:hypothetical protein
VQAAWKQPDDGEPNWYYDLDEMVYQALRHDVSAPVLALAKLAQGAQSMLVRPEANVYKDKSLLAEIDLWAIIDGQIVVGEAKTVSRLDSTRASERRIAARLAHVVLATTAPSWDEGSLTLVREALKRSGIPLRQLADLAASSARRPMMRQGVVGRPVQNRPGHSLGHPPAVTRQVRNVLDGRPR